MRGNNKCTTLYMVQVRAVTPLAFATSLAAAFTPVSNVETCSTRYPE